MSNDSKTDDQREPETGRIGEEGAAKKSNGIDEEGEGRVPLGDNPEHSKVSSARSPSEHLADGGSSDG